MKDDGLNAIDITPTAADPPSSVLGGIVKFFRGIAAFPIRVLTAIFANGIILVGGLCAIGIFASIFFGILGLIVAFLVLCLCVVVSLFLCFGLARIGDWISGNKTVSFIPTVLKKAAEKANARDGLDDLERQFGKMRR